MRLCVIGKGAMRNKLKNTAVAVCVLSMGTMSLFAMPTAKEISKVKDLVKDVAASGVKAMKSGEKTPVEDAASQVALAKEAGSEAEK